MKTKGILLKSYNKETGLFPKLLIDENKQLIIVEKDGTTYEIEAKKTKTGVFEYTFEGGDGSIVIPHGLGSDPSDVVITYDGTYDATIGAVTHDATNITIAFTGGVEDEKITVTWKVYE